MNLVRNIGIIGIFLATWLLSGHLFGQKQYSKAEVRQMFPDNVKNLWINTLSGHLDGIHLVDMIIGTDGVSCKGLYIMRNSGATFFFEGNDTDHQLQLVELTGDGRTSGFILGKYDGEKFEGVWMNKDKDQVLPMNLSFVNTFENHLPDLCKQKQWQRVFSAKINDKPVKLRVIRNDLMYTIMMQEGSAKMQDIIVGKGNRVEVIDLKFENSVFDRKSLVIDTANLDKMTIVHLDEGGYELSSVLKLEAALGFECYEYVDYHSRLVATILKTGNKRLDHWVENKYKKWIENSVEKLKKANTNFGTKDRWIQSAEGWVEVDLFTEDVVSGTIYLQTSLHHETEKIPFIYDLKMGKEIKIQDLFDGKFDAKRYFSVVIPAKKKEMILSNECKKWIDGQGFHYVTLNEKGICFRTDFHTIYGEKEILIPYDMVSENLKNRNLIKDLVAK